jgi:purine-binding chemotaxis protein CheW
LVPTSAKDDSVQLIGFYAGGKLYGVDILMTREILRDSRIESIRNAPPFIEGSVRIRGEVIPVVNLIKRLGKADCAEPSHENWVLIANVGDRVLAFLVDSVAQILKIRADSILPPPDLILSGLRSQYIRGVCNSEFGMLVVLDLNRMFGVDEIRALKKMVIHQST